MRHLRFSHAARGTAAPSLPRRRSPRRPRPAPCPRPGPAPPAAGGFGLVSRAPRAGGRRRRARSGRHRDAFPERVTADGPVPLARRIGRQRPPPLRASPEPSRPGPRSGDFRTEHRTGEPGPEPGPRARRDPDGGRRTHRAPPARAGCAARCRRRVPPDGPRPLPASRAAPGSRVFVSPSRPRPSGGHPHQRRRYCRGGSARPGGRASAGAGRPRSAGPEAPRDPDETEHA